MLFSLEPDTCFVCSFEKCYCVLVVRTCQLKVETKGRIRPSVGLTGTFLVEVLLLRGDKMTTMETRSLWRCQTHDLGPQTILSPPKCHTAHRKGRPFFKLRPPLYSTLQLNRVGFPHPGVIFPLSEQGCRGDEPGRNLGLVVGG